MASEEEVKELPLKSKITDAEPRWITCEVGEVEYFRVKVHFDGTKALILDAIEVRDEGTYTALEAAILDSYKEGESFNDVRLTTYVGTNSNNDQLVIMFRTRDKEDNIIEIQKEYIPDDIREKIKREDLKDRLKRGLPNAYKEVAYQDIRAACNSIIAPVNAKMPLQYHEIHVQYEYMFLKHPANFPEIDEMLTHDNKPLLKMHIKAHQLALEILKGTPIPEDWYE